MVVPVSLPSTEAILQPLETEKALVLAEALVAHINPSPSTEAPSLLQAEAAMPLRESVHLLTGLPVVSSPSAATLSWLQVVTVVSAPVAKAL